MNLGLAISDPNVAEFFTIVRSSVEFVAGGTETTQERIEIYGNVSAGGARDVDAQPEGDHISDTVNFWCQQEMYVTRMDPSQGLSDILIWRDEEFRVMSVLRYPMRGYWKAIAVRMAGD